MAAEVENPPVTAEVKEETAAPAADAPAEEAKEAAVVVEEVKEAVIVPKEAPAKKLNVFKQNFEKDVVYLYQFARTTSLPSLSPYVLKVETWLRLTGLKYEVSCRHLSCQIISTSHFPRRAFVTLNIPLRLIGINWI